MRTELRTLGIVVLATLLLAGCGDNDNSDFIDDNDSNDNTSSRTATPARTTTPALTPTAGVTPQATVTEVPTEVVATDTPIPEETETPAPRAEPAPTSTPVGRDPTVVTVTPTAGTQLHRKPTPAPTATAAAASAATVSRKPARNATPGRLRDATRTARRNAHAASAGPTPFTVTWGTKCTTCHPRVRSPRLADVSPWRGRDVPGALRVTTIRR